MGVRAPRPGPEPDERPQRFAPRLRVAAAVALIVFAVLLANGRPLSSGDTRPTERVAASLAQHLDFDLDEYPDVEPPFARQVGAHRVSIYPVLSAVLAAPIFAAAGTLAQLDELGLSLAGKLAAALFTALASAVMFLAVGRRHGEHDAFVPALLFALGTSLWSTSQALWQHPAAVLFLALSVWFRLRAEDDDVWAGRAGLPLALALASRHADVALVGALALGFALRWPRRIVKLALWGAPVALFVLAYQWHYFGAPLRHGFSGATAVRFAAPWGEGHLGLLLSPAKGWFVFTPLTLVALAGMLRAWRGRRSRGAVDDEHRRGERALVLSLGGGVVAHWLLMGRWSEWHGGASFGPRLMTDALPLLWVFLPEGLLAARRAGGVLALVSVAVQALGAFAYDLRWEKLYQRDAPAVERSLWRPSLSPLWFYASTRVLTPALPGLREGRVILREYPFVVGGAEGSRVAFEGERLRVFGSDPTLGDVHAQRGARLTDGALALQGRWDALFLRVRGAARDRQLELRVSGRGRGTLYVGERSFWSPTPRWAAYPVSGAFRVRHPYYFPTSGGGDLLVSLGKSGGEARLDAVALVAPGEPDRVLTLPDRP